MQVKAAAKKRRTVGEVKAATERKRATTERFSGGGGGGVGGGVRRLGLEKTGNVTDAVERFSGGGGSGFQVEAAAKKRRTVGEVKGGGGEVKGDDGEVFRRQRRRRWRRSEEIRAGEGRKAERRGMKSERKSERGI
ncbi:hypothetical protein Droror1_Dr00015625 [Drosera rotundifolia]